MYNTTFMRRVALTFVMALQVNLATAESADSKAMKLEEPPKIEALLSAGAKHEKTLNKPEAAWKAAVNYCEASRLGSIEAQYRLGMLYRFGKGVPANPKFAAALFSMASSQGHSEASNMLDSINLSSSELPPCVTSEALPERPLVSEADFTGNGMDIERRLATLSKHQRWIVDLTETISMRYDIDPKLVLAIIAVESNFNVKAQSNKQAMGLMQLIPGTADRFNIKNAFDATQNIKGGVRYLRWLLAYYHGNVRLVAAAYNAGEKAVDRYKGVPPYPETRNYVKRVLELYQQQSHPYDENITTPSPLITRPG